MDYQQAIDYISSYTDYEKQPMPHDPAFYDLRRVHELLARLGNPHHRARSVHIAGTKGKGSTAAMIASALVASGYVTGLYTSPHLHTWRERIKVNGELISEGELAALVEKVKPEVEAVNRKATYGQLTTFELLTALAFTYFGQKGVDFQVLEVGMGGKFDATNVIQPEVCVITTISFDHTEILGDTLAKIAAEKSGIIKPGSIVVTSRQTDEALGVIKATCLKHGVDLIKVGSDVTWQRLSFDLSCQTFKVKGELDSYQLAMPLLGDHQLDNAATAVATLEVLARKGFNISRDSIANGLATVNWPGRFQILRRRPLLVVDGAHNPDSACRLRQSVEQYAGYFNQAILIIGTSSDKDIAGIVKELASPFNKVIVTRSRHPRSIAVSSLVAEFGKHGIGAQVVESVAEALSAALKLAGEDGFICATGSLFVVAEAIEQAEKLASQTKI